MAKVSTLSIKTYPALKVIGLPFKVRMMDSDIPRQWDLFFKEDKHRILEDLRTRYPITQPLDYVGFMYDYDPLSATMIYLIGAIMDAKTPDPVGYASYLLPEGLVIETLIEGKDEVFSQAHDLTIRAVDEKNYALPEEFWSMEVYSQMFMEAQKKQDGSVVLEYRIPILKK